MEMIEIAGEADLYAALQRVVEDGVGADWSVEFQGWPNFEVTIRGLSFDGGVPTRIMPALLALQKVVDKAYARLTYGTEQRLSKEERKYTELVVHFQAGRSTTFISKMSPILNAIAQQAVRKMSARELMIVILGMAALIAGGYVWKTHLNAMLDEKEIDQKLELSREETRRYELLRKAADLSPVLHDQMLQMQLLQETLLKRLAPADQLVIDDIPVIDGETAQRIIRRPRAEAVESRLDAEFIILSVDSGQVPGGFRLKVRNIHTNEVLTVKVPEGTLSLDQTQALQTGEWEKKPVAMKINVKMINDRLADATLIRAGLF